MLLCDVFKDECSRYTDTSHAVFNYSEAMMLMHHACKVSIESIDILIYDRCIHFICLIKCFDLLSGQRISRILNNVVPQYYLTGCLFGLVSTL